MSDDRSDNPVFVYAAVYADRADADADYDTLLDLHSADLVGTYDVALMYKDDEGKVHVTKHEKPTQHGAWTGAAVGALVGIIFPPAILGAAVVGAAAGGGIGHALGGMSRSDAKELGEQLGDGQAALIVIGKSRVGEQLDKALTRAEKSEEREIDADAKELEKEDSSRCPASCDWAALTSRCRLGGTSECRRGCRPKKSARRSPITPSTARRGGA